MSEESQSLDTPQGPSRQDLENALRVELVKQQDIVYGIVGGLATAIVAALLWALVTVATKYQIGYMAIGVGLLVGVGVKIFGAGVDKYFGVVAAVLALFGCALGNVLSQLAFAADQQSLSYWAALGYLNLDLIVSLLKEGFNPMDVLFYGLAASAAYRISIRKIDDELTIAVNEGKVSPPPYARYRLPAVIIFLGVIVSTVIVLYENTGGPKTYTYESGAKRSVGEITDGREVGPWESYYEDGTLMQKGFFDNGRPDSAWSYYNEMGNVLREGKFRKGLEEGEWIFYNEDGSVMAKGNYRYGRQTGPWTYFHKNGAAMESGLCIVDLRDGEWESFFESGKLSSKGRYDYGEKVGVWTSWNENGDKIEELEYTDGHSKILYMSASDGKPMINGGNGKYTVYHENGNVREMGLVKNGFREGAWKIFFDDNKPMEEGEYRKGEYFVKTRWAPTGETMATDGSGMLHYIEDGIVEMSGKINNGVRVDEWVSRIVGSDSDSASVSTRIFYKEGKFDGDYVTYRETGEVAMQGTCKDGKREGEWTWFQNDGAVESKVTFVSGKKEGEQLFYNVYADLLKTEVYKAGKLVETRLSE